MKFKTAVIQNLLLAIGVAAIYKYFSLRYVYSLFVTREKGMPLLDGDGISLFSDEGIHWTSAITAGNGFLIFGIILIIISICILICSTRRKQHHQNIE